MRLIVPEDWSVADIMRGCLRHFETGTLPNNGASDYSWDVVMMGQKNLLGQLEAVKKMQDARERRDRAGRALIVIVPPLQEGGSPSYSAPVKETATETTLRSGIAPPHGIVITVSAEEYENRRENAFMS